MEISNFPHGECLPLSADDRKLKGNVTGLIGFATLPGSNGCSQALTYPLIRLALLRCERCVAPRMHGGGPHSRLRGRRCPSQLPQPPCLTLVPARFLLHTLQNCE